MAYKSEYVKLMFNGRRGVDIQKVPGSLLQGLFLSSRQLRIGNVILLNLLLDGPVIDLRAVDLAAAIEAIIRVDVSLYKALLECADVSEQIAVFILEAIGVTSRCCAAGDAVGDLALGLRVDAGTFVSHLILRI